MTFEEQRKKIKYPCFLPVWQIFNIFAYGLIFVVSSLFFKKAKKDNAKRKEKEEKDRKAKERAVRLCVTISLSKLEL